MNSKIYALYVKDRNHDRLVCEYKDYRLKISSEKHWEMQRPLLENTEEKVVKYNSCIYLSFSRATLVKKAKEIKTGWIEEVKRDMEIIENINIK